MHRLPSTSAVVRFRIAAMLLVIVWLLAPAAIAVLGYSVFIHDQELALLGAALGGAALVVAVFQLVVASKARCPLCMTPSLAHKACSKHRNSRRLFGSYRLMAAVSLVARGHFRCPYCNEPTVMAPRVPNR